MAWVYLFIAGFFEMGWAVGLKLSHGFTKFWPSVGTGIAFLASMGFLSLALKSLPIGTAYGIWTGIGAVGTVFIGMLLFDEPRDIARLLCIALIVIGIIGLKLTER